jgi:hypothetical protein
MIGFAMIDEDEASRLYKKVQNIYKQEKCMSIIYSCVSEPLADKITTAQHPPKLKARRRRRKPKTAKSTN